MRRISMAPAQRSPLPLNLTPSGFQGSCEDPGKDAFQSLDLTPTTSALLILLFLPDPSLSSPDFQSR